MLKRARQKKKNMWVLVRERERGGKGTWATLMMRFRNLGWIPACCLSLEAMGLQRVFKARAPNFTTGRTTIVFFLFLLAFGFSFLSLSSCNLFFLLLVFLLRANCYNKHSLNAFFNDLLFICFWFWKLDLTGKLPNENATLTWGSSPFSHPSACLTSRKKGNFYFFYLIKGKPNRPKFAMLSNSAHSLKFWPSFGWLKVYTK